MGVRVQLVLKKTCYKYYYHGHYEALEYKILMMDGQQIIIKIIIILIIV